MSYINNVKVNKNGLGVDAWGKNKVVNDYSLFHGSWTHFVAARKWIEYFNQVERPITSFSSVNGELVGVSGAGTSALKSNRHAKYQANRGLLYSSSCFIDNVTPINPGGLYACINKDGVITETLIPLENLPAGFDPTKGNIYDIQMQWRGVGNMKFFINLEEVFEYSLLGTLDNLSIRDPAVAVTLGLSNTGLVNFGMFSHGNGVFFRWKFDTPQETKARMGCVDLTSEGGKEEERTYTSVSTSTLTGSVGVNGFNSPVIAIRLPDTIGGKANSVDAALNRLSAYADQRSILRVWGTRGGAGILTGTWTPVQEGSVEVSEDLTIDTTQMVLVHSRRIRIDETESFGVSDPSSKLIMTHNDTIVVTIHRENGGVALAGATLELGLEI